MNKYNGLLSKVSRQYHISRGTQETENEWKTRIVYSICGMMAYACLWDDTEEPISIVHLKRRIHSVAKIGIPAPSARSLSTTFTH